MNPRFVLLTFASCIVVFAGIWAATAPRTPAAPVAAPVEAVMYADCDAVRAANAAPLRASQPGYRPALDPNMNGIACETSGGFDNGSTAVTPPPVTPDDGQPAAPPTEAAPPPPPPPPSSVSAEKANPPPPGARPPSLTPPG